jgi:hypothetical protein
VALGATFDVEPSRLLSYGFDYAAVRFARNNDDLMAIAGVPLGTAYFPCFGRPGTPSGPECLVTGWRCTVAPGHSSTSTALLQPAVAYSATQRDRERRGHAYPRRTQNLYTGCNVPFAASDSCFDAPFGAFRRAT